MTQTAESPAAPAPGPDAEAPHGRHGGGNGVGIAAFVAGALGLAPIALVLGIVGLARYRSGRASRRNWALAGTVLGAIGLVAGAAIGVIYATSDAPLLTQDAHAKVDAVNLGNAVVDWYIAHPDGGVAPVVITDAGYAVGETAIAATVAVNGGRGVILEAPDPWSWCLTLEYSGGASSSVGYSATEGLVGSCRAG